LRKWGQGKSGLAELNQSRVRFVLSAVIRCGVGAASTNMLTKHDRPRALDPVRTSDSRVTT